MASDDAEILGALMISRALKDISGSIDNSGEKISESLGDVAYSIRLLTYGPTGIVKVDGRFYREDGMFSPDEQEARDYAYSVIQHIYDNTEDEITDFSFADKFVYVQDALEGIAMDGYLITDEVGDWVQQALEEIAEKGL